MSVTRIIPTPEMLWQLEQNNARSFSEVAAHHRLEAERLDNIAADHFRKAESYRALIPAERLAEIDLERLAKART